MHNNVIIGLDEKKIDAGHEIQEKGECSPAFKTFTG